MLAEMEPVDLDTKVSATTAVLARGLSAVTTTEAQQRDARSRLEWATAEARRHVELGREGVVSQNLVEGKLLEQRTAEAQLAVADAGLAGAREDLARLSADLGGARQQRDNIRLLAPVAGVVTARAAEPGSTVVAGQPVLTLEEPASQWITMRVDQGRSAGLRAGLPATITVRSAPGEAHRGRVVRIDPISDSVTEERIARVAFDHRPPGVSTGEMAEVTLHLPAVAGALIVPNASLRSRGAQMGVWLRANGRLRFAPVKAGAEGLEGMVQILEGLRAGDEVVVYSERDLDDGSRIRVVAALRGASR
jgi:HlyD family secretion protein